MSSRLLGSERGLFAQLGRVCWLGKDQAEPCKIYTSAAPTRTLPARRGMRQNKQCTAQSLCHNCDGVSFSRHSHLQERGSRSQVNMKTLHQVAKSRPLREPRGRMLHPATFPHLENHVVSKAWVGQALEGVKWQERFPALGSARGILLWGAALALSALPPARWTDRHLWGRRGAMGVRDGANSSSLLERREGRRGARKGLVRHSQFTQFLY